jgi:DNA-directed RNA polymerase alpha subunit
MTQSLWDSSIDELDLTVRSRNGLMRCGADTIGKVSRLIMSDKGLTSVRNLGRKSIAEIKTALLVKGYEQLSPAEQLEFWQRFIAGNGLV